VCDLDDTGPSIFKIIRSVTVLQRIIAHLDFIFKLFIINGKSERYKEDQYRIVGTVKDEKIKVRGLHVSYTLG
jgi:hypothetical protein